MRIRRGPIETLGHCCEAERLLWALCRNCGHTVRFDPRNLIALRGDRTLREIQQQLKCQRCHYARAALVVDYDHWPSR